MWPTGSFSIRSPAVVVTSTTVEVSPGFSKAFTVIGTVDRTSASWVMVAKLGAEIVMWYGFSGRLVNWYWPPASVVVCRLNPLTGFSMVTLAPWTRAPVASVTVP